MLLWLINITNYVGLYFVLLWTPAILHSTGVSPARAILGTTIYGVGVLASPLLAAFIVGRLGIERVLAVCLAFGGLCAAAIGFVAPQFWLLALLLAGVGIGNGCQAGINSLSGLVYPAGIRSTGAGWAMGMGRIGTIGGPLFGGLLLSRSASTPQTMFLIASISGVRRVHAHGDARTASRSVTFPEYAIRLGEGRKTVTVASRPLTRY